MVSQMKQDLSVILKNITTRRHQDSEKKIKGISKKIWAFPYLFYVKTG